ncbi:MAG TPA: hypothetical protein VJJ53_00200 [Candidatus Nanoarchaeia archaeon]|nr:hypothetical protein [Candidatus Nanoarchaeia archaeon]
MVKEREIAGVKIIELESREVLDINSVHGDTPIAVMDLAGMYAAAALVQPDGKVKAIDSISRVGVPYNTITAIENIKKKNITLDKGLVMGEQALDPSIRHLLKDVRAPTKNLKTIEEDLEFYKTFGPHLLKKLGLKEGEKYILTVTLPNAFRDEVPENFMRATWDIGAELKLDVKGITVVREAEALAFKYNIKSHAISVSGGDTTTEIGLVVPIEQDNLERKIDVPYYSTIFSAGRKVRESASKFIREDLERRGYNPRSQGFRGDIERIMCEKYLAIRFPEEDLDEKDLMALPENKRYKVTVDLRDKLGDKALRLGIQGNPLDLTMIEAPQREFVDNAFNGVIKILKEEGEKEDVVRESLETVIVSGGSFLPKNSVEYLVRKLVEADCMPGEVIHDTDHKYSTVIGAALVTAERQYLQRSRE